MSKNMTRKGLAFGAGLSLVVSGFAALPAQATGITGLIDLVPTSGPENALAIQTSDGASFSVSASPASSVMSGSGTVKFLVTDPEAKFTPGALSTAGYTQAATTGAINAAAGRLAVANVTSDGVVLNVATSIPDGQYVFYVNDANLVLEDGSDSTPQVTALTKDKLTTGYVYGDQLFFQSEGDIVASVDDIDATVSLTLVGGGSVSASSTTAAVADNATASSSSGVVTIRPASALAAGVYLVSSDVAIKIDDKSDDTDENTVMAAGEKFILKSDGTDYTFVNDSAITGTEGDIDGVDGAFTLTVHSLGNPRSLTNSYVVDSRVTASGSVAALEMIATDSVSRSVTVQAFVDDFDNATINTTEYVSSAVTLSYLAQADISFSSSLDAPKPGDDKLTGYVTTTPLINDGENDIANWIGGVFTRQDSVTNALVYGGTQSLVTGRWPVEVALATGTTLNHWTNSTTDIDTDENWNKSYDAATTAGVDMDNPHTVDASSTVMDGSTIVVKDKVATVTVRRNDNEITPNDTDSDADIIAAHFLRVGDKVTFEDDTTPASIAAKQFTVTSVPSPSTFTFALDVADGTLVALADFDHAEFEVSTWGTAASGVSVVDRVFAGDYSLTAAVYTGTANRYAAKGTASGLGTQAAVAEDIIYTTDATASIQGRTIRDSGAGVDVVAKTGTLSVVVTATVVDEDDAAVGAGRAVVYTLTRGAHTTIQVNGKTTGDTLVTDANGQVKFTITDTTGGNGKQVTISATAEGVAGATSDITVKWEDAAYTLYDLATTDATLASTDRHIAKSSSYDLSLLVADQWLTVAPAADYRIAVTGSGVTQGAVALTDGKATVKVTDGGVSASYGTTLTVQKKGTTGTWADTTSTVTITHKVSSAPALTLGANGSSLYGNTVATTSAVAKVALVELDKRVDLKTATPAYVNKAVLNGKATNATSGVSLGGSVVTISGPTNILFENGQVAKRGGLTVVADQTTGQFEFNLYSTTAQKDTVIKVTANGITKEIKVTFTGIGVGEGTALTVTAPEAVKPASTFQVKAKLADTYGNGVDTAAGRVKVTYTGPGIVFGTLPTETDANGELMFSVLLGSNDTGSVVVTVSYDQNGDADYVDAKDLNTTKTIVISASGTTTTGKVNVGSFNGKLVVYASGLNGATISWKVGGNWGKAVATSDFARFDRLTPRRGVTVSVDIYVNGVKTLTKSVVTR